MSTYPHPTTPQWPTGFLSSPTSPLPTGMTDPASSLSSTTLQQPSSLPPPQPTWMIAIKDIIAGSIGGAARIPPGHPFDTVKVHLQTDIQSRGMINTFVSIIKKDGFLGLYRGAQSPLFGMAALNAALFFAFGQGQDYVLKRTGRREMTDVERMFVGWWAGFWCSIVEGPVDFFKCQLQMNSKNYTGFWNCTYVVARKYGIRGVFQGFGPTLLRNIPAYGFFFSAYELTRKFLAKPGQNLSDIGPVKTLIAGGMGGFSFWFFTYPVDVIKSAMQADAIQPEKRKYKTMVDCARKIFAENGARGFLKGICPCLVRSFPANAFAWAGYEYSMKVMNRRTGH